MNQFIELTDSKREMRFTINVSFIIKVQPHNERCIILLSSDVTCAVNESYDEVIELIRSVK